ncbi:MAG: redoxin domain-containing protein [Flavobacteriales bacterium]
MKTLLMCCLLLTATTFTSDVNEILEIGAKAPMTNVKMMDVSGESLALEDIKKENGLLVVFSCNTCPFVVGGKGEGWEGRYNDVHLRCEKNRVGMVLVNSNEAKREGDDSFEEMKSHAKEQGYQSYYVVDENSALADAFGAKTTPHVYMFNGDMELVYKGAIDDNVESSEEVKEEWLIDALNNLGAGKEIDPNSTRQLGCSIKRVK